MIGKGGNFRNGSSGFLFTGLLGEGSGNRFSSWVVLTDMIVNADEQRLWGIMGGDFYVCRVDLI